MDVTTTLQEVVLAEHFRQPLPLTILDIADWAREFSEFGDPHQLPWLPPISFPQPSFPIAFGGPQDLPRLLLRSGSNYIQLQADRFAFGWTRTSPIGEKEAYPGYEGLKREQSRNAQKFRTWCLRKFGISPDSRLVELVYNNAAPLVVEGRRRKISEIFGWVQPGRPVNLFQVSWGELLEQGRIDGPRVNGLVVAGSAPVVPEALIFNFAGLAPIDKDEGDTKLRAWDALHERILAIYEATIFAGEK